MFKVVMIANDDHPIPSWLNERFQAAGIDFVYRQCYGRSDLEQCAADADVLMLMSSRKGLVVEEHMDIFRKVGAVIKCGSGTDNIDHAACTKRGIIVAHTPEDATEPTSDHTVAMLLTAARQTARQDRMVRRGEWEPRSALPIAKLTGADLGVIGFGRIARMVVRKLSGFDMTVRVCDPFVDAPAVKAAGCMKIDLDDLLRQSQIVLVCCPLTKETTNLLSDDKLRLMRRDSILINCARAGIVDEKALIQALREGRIRAAAFDVLADHPLKSGNEFLELENITLTPHMGGYPADYPESTFKSVVEVIIDMSRMRKPRWIANPGVVPKWKMA